MLTFAKGVIADDRHRRSLKRGILRNIQKRFERFGAWIIEGDVANFRQKKHLLIYTLYYFAWGKGIQAKKPKFSADKVFQPYNT